MKIKKSNVRSFGLTHLVPQSNGLCRWARVPRGMLSDSFKPIMIQLFTLEVIHLLEGPNNGHSTPEVKENKGKKARYLAGFKSVASE